MSDLNLIAFGCGVSFISIAGCYVYVRESYLASVRRAEAKGTRRSDEARRQARREAHSAA